MTDTRRKYIRTEPPALLSEPLTLTLRGHVLEALNAYRQAKHAWLSFSGATDERARLREAAERAGSDLAVFVAIEAQYQLGEPDEYDGPVE